MVGSPLCLNVRQTVPINKSNQEPRLLTEVLFTILTMYAQINIRPAVNGISRHNVMPIAPTVGVKHKMTEVRCAKRLLLNNSKVSIVRAKLKIKAWIITTICGNNPLKERILTKKFHSDAPGTSHFPLLAFPIALKESVE
jgi:hypothetical protein